MSKETILKEFMNLKFENKQHFGRCADSKMIFEKVFEPLLSKAINQTREETIREIEKKIVKYIDENKKKNFNNRELIGYEILDLIN